MARRKKTDELNSVEQELLDNILKMFHVLKTCYDRLPDRSGIAPEDIRFNGFDANDPYESKFNLYSGDGNSHMKRLPWYRLMLDRWRASADKENLTHEDIVRITAPFPRPAKTW